MIVFKLKSQIDIKAARDSRNLSFAIVAGETGIAEIILKKMSGRAEYNAGLDKIDKLCSYFGCQPGDLLEHVDTSPSEPDNSGNQNSQR